MWRNWSSWVGFLIGLIVVLITMTSLAASWGPRDAPRPDDAMRGHTFTADYSAREHDGGLDLDVTEVVVIDFTSSARGIIRDIPTRYRGHSNEVRDVQVEWGPVSPGGEAPVAWEQAQTQVDTDSGVTSIRIGSVNAYLEPGRYAYRISYTFTDVALNTFGGQEIYQNANGNQWGTGFDRVEATLLVPASLADRLNGDAACYQGPEGSRERCTIARTEGADGTVFTATSDAALGAFEGVTFAVGFEPATFQRASTPRTPTLWRLPFLLATSSVGLVALAVAQVRRWLARPRRDADAAVRYAPPKDLPLMAAADVWGVAERGPTAELIAAVLDGEVRFTTGGNFADQYAQAGPPRRLSRGEAKRLRAGFVAEGLQEVRDDTTRKLLLDYFPAGRIDPSHVPHAVTEDRRRALVESLGLRRPGGSGRWFVKSYVLLLLLVALSTVFLWAMGDHWWVVWITGIVGLLLLVAAAFRMPTGGRLTEHGEAVLGELQGLERFMSMAEKDRIAWLQSTSSAPRLRDADDRARVKLYEPLLPYAVIFGLEDSWADLVGADLDGNRSRWLLGGASVAFAQLLSSVSGPRPGTRASFAPGRRTLRQASTSFATGLTKFSSGGSGRGGGSRRGGSRGGGRSGGGRGGGGGRSW